MNIENIVRNLGLPLAVVAVIVAVLALFGLDAERIAQMALTLVGVQACILLVIDVLKWSGVVNDGTAGRWSAVLHAIVFVMLIVQIKFFPVINVAGLDAQLLEFAKAGGVVFLYVTQIVGTKSLRELGVTLYSFNNATPPTPSVR